MKKLILVILLVCMVGLIFTGCGGSLPAGGSGGGDSRVDREYQIKVSGTTGLKFSGSYTSFTKATSASGGNYTSPSGVQYTPKTVIIEGVVPAEYSAKGISVSVNIKKEAESGTLKVEIFEAGTPMTTVTEITAPYGMASIGR